MYWRHVHVACEHRRKLFLFPSDRGYYIMSIELTNETALLKYGLEVKHRFQKHYDWMRPMNASPDHPLFLLLHLYTKQIDILISSNLVTMICQTYPNFDYY